MPITRIYQSSRQMEEFEEFIGGEMQPFVSILQEQSTKIEGADVATVSVEGVPLVPETLQGEEKKKILWHRIIGLFEKAKNKKTAKNF